MEQRKSEMDLVTNLFGQANKIRSDLAIYQVKDAIKESNLLDDEIYQSINTLEDELELQREQMNASIRVLQNEKLNLKLYRQNLKDETRILIDKLKDEMQNSAILGFLIVAWEIAKFLLTLALIVLRTQQSQRISHASLQGHPWQNDIK